MKRSSVPAQRDLFCSLHAPPTLMSLELRHDELVDLLSRMLWEVVSSVDQTMPKESPDDQD